MLNVGSKTSGSLSSFQKFSTSRFAYKHLFVVEGVDNLRSGSTSIGGLEMPSLFILRGVFPYQFINVAPVERDNSNIYYPDIVDVNQVELEFYETMDNVVWNYFEAWFGLIFKEDKGGNKVFNLPVNFKKDILMFRLDTMPKEGSDKDTFARVFGYRYTGCFPVRIGDYSLDMADPGVVNLSITFAVDNVERLTGSGIVEPTMMDRSNGIPSTNPVTEQKRPDSTSQTKEGVPTANPVTETAKKGMHLAEGSAEFIKAIIKAAAFTGINIAKREAAYIAYYMMNRNEAIPYVIGGARAADNLRKEF